MMDQVGIISKGYCLWLMIVTLPRSFLRSNSWQKIHKSHWKKSWMWILVQWCSPWPDELLDARVALDNALGSNTATYVKVLVVGQTIYLFALMLQPDMKFLTSLCCGWYYPRYLWFSLPPCRISDFFIVRNPKEIPLLSPSLACLVYVPLLSS